MKAKSKMLLSTMIALILCFSFVISTPVTAFAGVTVESSSNSSSKKKDEKYFSDVKKGTSHRAEIEWLAKKGAYKGIAKKGKKFQPNRIITRREFGRILNNLYGDRIDITISDPNSKATQKFVTKTLTEVSKQLGYRVSWSGGAPKARVSRGDASYYLRWMMKTAERGALDP